MVEDAAVGERGERVNGIVPSSFNLPYVTLICLLEQSQWMQPQRGSQTSVQPTSNTDSSRGTRFPGPAYSNGCSRFVAKKRT